MPSPIFIVTYFLLLPLKLSILITSCFLPFPRHLQIASSFMLGKGVPSGCRVLCLCSSQGPSETPFRSQHKGGLPVNDLPTLPYNPSLSFHVCARNSCSSLNSLLMPTFSNFLLMRQGHVTSSGPRAVSGSEMCHFRSKHLELVHDLPTLPSAVGSCRGRVIRWQNHKTATA